MVPMGAWLLASRNARTKAPTALVVRGVEHPVHAVYGMGQLWQTGRVQAHALPVVGLPTIVLAPTQSCSDARSRLRRQGNQVALVLNPP